MYIYIYLQKNIVKMCVCVVWHKKKRTARCLNAFHLKHETARGSGLCRFFWHMYTYKTFEKQFVCNIIWALVMCIYIYITDWIEFSSNIFVHQTAFCFLCNCYFKQSFEFTYIAWFWILKSRNWKLETWHLGLKFYLKFKLELAT